MRDGSQDSNAFMHGIKQKRLRDGASTRTSYPSSMNPLTNTMKPRDTNLWMNGLRQGQDKANRMHQETDTRESFLARENANNQIQRNETKIMCCWFAGYLQIIHRRDFILILSPGMLPLIRKRESNTLLVLMGYPHYQNDTEVLSYISSFYRTLAVDEGWYFVHLGTFVPLINRKQYLPSPTPMSSPHSI